MSRLSRLVPRILRGNGFAALWLRAQIRLLLLIAFVVGVLVATTLAFVLIRQQTSETTMQVLAEVRSEWPLLRDMLRKDRTLRPTVVRWILEYGLGASADSSGTFLTLGPARYAATDLAFWLENGRRIDPLSGRDLGPAPVALQATGPDMSAGQLLGDVAGLLQDERKASVLVLPVDATTRLAVIMPSRLFSTGEVVVFFVQVFLMIWLSTALLLILLALLVAGRIARREADRLTAPLRHLEQVSHALAAGRLDARVSVDGADEILALGRQFNAMGEALERSVTELNAVLQSRSRLLADISHELRTPLTLVIGHAERLERVPEARHDAAIITEASLDMKRLLRDLMDTARLETVSLGVQSKAIDIAPIAVRTVEAFAMAAARAGVELTCLAAPAIALADAERLRQVLSNLLANALRHTPREGRVVVRVERVPDAVTVEVMDSGSGMDDADATRAFERGFSRQTAAEGETHGLGLAICKRLTEAMGGRIAIDSQPGCGTRVAVTLQAPP